MTPKHIIDWSKTTCGIANKLGHSIAEVSSKRNKETKILPIKPEHNEIVNKLFRVDNFDVLVEKQSELNTPNGISREEKPARRLPANDPVG